MKRKQQHSAVNSRATGANRAVGGEFGRLLTGRPTVAGVVWLVLIVMVIGVSGSYLVYRAAGPAATTGSGTGLDPAAPLRARLLQNPKDVEALLGLAHLELDQKQLDQAESLYRQVLAQEPKNVEAITHLGTVLLGRGQVDAALQHYNQALAIQPAYVHALWDKANLLQRDKLDYAGAIRTWEAFIQAVGPDSQDGKTAQNFITEAKQAMGNAPSPVEKAFGGKS
ncbi:MAG TPA: tetratricopeptide repeat protein [Candidatus Methylomirabilis sp.]|nr:tetratricopeptide repeat protein [Candidatus Methylomirabilis sp.]HSC69805.1 tetratricopeptide repeat protein [Candidatus Methylomirabilis sp.]